MKVYLYSPFMPSRRGQEQFLLDGPCLFLRAGVISCVEVALRGQARYGKAAFLKLLVALHGDFFFPRGF